MDWRGQAFDWNRARAFLVTAEEGSLSAAARALGLTQPTLGRQVAALEAELGVALFERAGRGLTLTPSGVELLDHVRAMGDAAGRLSLAASGQAQTVEGRVTISATEATAAYVLPEIVAAICEAAPKLTIAIVASNALSDLRRREADIAIRAARPTDPELIARRLADEPVHLYAAPALLDRLGRPQTMAGLKDAPFIGFEENEQWVEALESRGCPVNAENFQVMTASHPVHWELVKAGLGIGVMPQRVGDRTAGVERAVPGPAPFPVPVWLVAHREVRTSRRVRLVFDRLATLLGEREPDAEAPISSDTARR